MSRPKEAETGSVQFAWGEKKGRAKDKDVQFYGSFTYDGVEYSLYDCVYLCPENEPEPFVGKIVKIWEQPGHLRRVKVLWFFRPIEILNFLAEYEKPQKKEIFLATGEGTGVFDVNRLEAIAGKCNVICTSRDKRNPQPLDEELKAADYTFYRTFDVSSYRISDKIGDTIAGIEAKYIFNQRETSRNAWEDGKSDKNVTRNKSLYPDSLEPEADQSIGKNLLGEKAIPKSEQALDTDARKARLVDAIDDKPYKKIRLTDAPKPAEHFQKNGSSVQKKIVILDRIDKKASVDATKVPLDKAKLKHDADLVGLGRGSAGKSMLDATTSVSPDKSFKKAAPGLLDEQKATDETVVVPRKPEDTSKFFTGARWEDRMWRAHDQGTLVLLENFDMAYTAEEIEDLIFHSFNKKCTARVIEMSTFSNLNNGQALIICKSRGDADEIVKELKTRVLMFSGRPLIARRVNPKQPGKSPKFFGHLAIDKLKQQMQREEWRKAVSTSHCAQPNTIEYEMGMDWLLLQEKSMNWWKELYEGHKEEIRQIAKEAKHR